MFEVTGLVLEYLIISGFNIDEELVFLCFVLFFKLKGKTSSIPVFVCLICSVTSKVNS